ncbi:MAG TPA: hypothetical protein VK447_13550 [Myxococcaceae bacterium]|nr:hypothetical protein [Myxococcaceae bacterium]
MPENIKKLLEQIEAAARAEGGLPQIAQFLDVDVRIQAALYWDSIKRIAAHQLSGERIQWTLVSGIAVTVAGMNVVGREAAYKTARDIILRGLGEFLSESVELGYGLIEATLRYKQRSEWFRRERLRDIAGRGLEGKKMERALAIDLYEYVFDRNLEFVIEPTSGSGEVDLVFRSPTGGHGILDVKYLYETQPSKIKQKLRDGFHQVSRYCNDYNESFGILVPFVATPKVPRLPLEEADGLSFLPLHGKRIYYIPVTIWDQPSASTAGKPEEVEITLADLISNAPPDGS